MYYSVTSRLVVQSMKMLVFNLAFQRMSLFKKFPHLSLEQSLLRASGMFLQPFPFSLAW